MIRSLSRKLKKDWLLFTGKGYLDVLSSWCYRAEPAWRELKNRYAKSAVEFDWKIALWDETGIQSRDSSATGFIAAAGALYVRRSC